MVEPVPTKELLFVLIDAKARTGRRMEGCDVGRELGAYGHDELNNNAMSIRKRWGGVFQTLLKRKSPKRDLTITILFPQRPLAPSLGVEPTMDDMMGVIPGTPNWKAIAPDSLPAEVLKLDHPEFIRYFHHLLVDVWSTREVPQQWNDATIKSPP